jgi:hypothetical protein
MAYALAGFCAVNCWVVSKLWEMFRARRLTHPPNPPHGGTVVRLHRHRARHMAVAAQPPMALAA